MRGKLMSQYTIENIIKEYDYICIDSNIWMNGEKEYEKFFIALYHVLQQQGKAFTLHGPQFDEICNIKRKTQYGEKKNARSRTAIDRIDQFQAYGLLNIIPIQIEPVPGVYADPLIIQLLLKVGKKDNKVCLITDDKELRIRARQVLNDNKISNLVLGIPSIIYQSKLFTSSNLFSYLRFHKIFSVKKTDFGFSTPNIILAICLILFYWFLDWSHENIDTYNNLFAAVGFIIAGFAAWGKRLKVGIWWMWAITGAFLGSLIGQILLIIFYSNIKYIIIVASVYLIFKLNFSKEQDNLLENNPSVDTSHSD
jgi:hypothetical protein